MSKNGGDVELSNDAMDLMIKNDDAFDAVICILTAVDFLKQDVIKPDYLQMEMAKKESWIWVKKP
ncbi:MAG: hypothetical protein DRH24_06710 [Deltaproteobacteria bacterium]|nr:MAG: hypothetical protein DRH24_06710 [Deltaproteobacteria bacterium]